MEDFVDVCRSVSKTYVSILSNFETRKKYMNYVKRRKVNEIDNNYTS